MSIKIISRSEWNARPSDLSPADWTNVRLWIHHTVGVNPTPSASQEYESRIVRDIQAFHIFTRGWADIGYSYLVAPSGRLYEGRGFEKWGAHSPSVNGEPSVALMGDYSKVDPTFEQIESVFELADYLEVMGIRGHRDSYPTACPGDAAYYVLTNGDTDPPLPHGNTLRLVIHGHPKSPFAGWEEAEGPLRWVAKNGLQPVPSLAKGDHAIAWRSHVWRGHKDVTNVARNLVRRYLNTED